MPLTHGARIGTYEIVSLLGAGGMGEVYRARDLRLGREVALKVLPADVASNPDRLARFEREARTVAGLNHPNIVTLFSVEDDAGIRFLTMELVEGQTLAGLVTPGGLALPRVLDLAIPLAEALSAAHERAVIHRDLKPGNVMVTQEGRIKVLDFGLAKMLAPRPESVDPQAETVSAPLSLPGELVGTMPYMAPEQIRGEAVDARSDLFAFGIILYELLAGRRPFAGSTAILASAAILHEPPVPLTRVRSDLPADVERIVSRCLEKSPRERPQTALEVTHELRRVRQELEQGEARQPADRVASIAVLPFVNRSRDEEDEYFSDGLADELLNVLAKIRGLRVAARTSAFQFKATKDDIGTIGRKLKVATLLEGSVRKAGDRVRISVQLIKVSDGYHLWSETYDRKLEDVFAVQDDIAQSVVRELRATLLGEDAASDAPERVQAEVAQAVRGRGTVPEAYRLYLLARHLLDRFTREDTAKAIEYLEEALELDPGFALAWAELGGAHTRGASWGWIPVAQGYGQAREAVERALAMEPDLAEGHAQMGGIRISYDWDWQGAAASFARALELAPGNASVLRLAVHLARTEGRLEDAIARYHVALQQDPLSAATYNGLGTALHDADHFPEAELAFRRSLELAPHRAVTRAKLSLTLLARGVGGEALNLAMEEPDENYRLWALAIVQHAIGHQAESDATLREFIEKHAERAAARIADVCAARGEADRAFEWLERAYAQRDPFLPEVRTDTHLRSLRDDPRWSSVLMKMGFAE